MVIRTERTERLLDWESRLDNYIQEHKNTPGLYGISDCYLFAMGGIEAMTGVDFAEFRGKYTNELGAARLIAREGGIESVMDRTFTKIPPLMAQRGDLVLLKDGPAMGLCYLDGKTVVAKTESGITTRPLSEIKAAWRI